ncbi:hypothetical protein GGQ68_004645 [Sagittula marina]|uniref:Uncharacterized protein n=1 Tax=Sagittula marina TaxID=943940 RepID=A0A7W6DY34_9RHOB|nr:hypothetical protein [Sagittula marina]
MTRANLPMPGFILIRAFIFDSAVMTGGQRIALELNRESSPLQK